MSHRYRPPHLFFLIGVVQVTRAGAIAASEAVHGYKPLANAPGNEAFQVQVGSGDDRL